MPIHRQTNRRRVSDAAVRAILQERVRNHLSIDAKAVRRLGIACGSCRLSRLRRRVLRDAAAPETMDAPTGTVSAPMAERSPACVTPDCRISKPEEREGARGASSVRTERPTCLSGRAVLRAALRRLVAMVRRLAPHGNAPSAK
jgi:hypothetical protein